MVGESSAVGIVLHALAPKRLRAAGIVEEEGRLTVHYR